MTRPSLSPSASDGFADADIDRDAGLDRKQLLQTRKRFLQLNRERLERLRLSARERERELIDLLPLLFHVNHALLPGWLDMDVPCSISDYTPGQTTLQAARRVARGFHYEKRASLKRDLHALYLMGSTGTVGHSGDSDLDVWLIHRDDLSSEGIARLVEKARRITSYAQREGVSLHVYPMTANAARRGEFGPLGSEHSGSTQHLLLLDEFYRSALLLAGRLPLWWLVPPEQHDQYDAYAARLLSHRYVRASDVVDFGNVDRIPAAEFFSGALWQLNKAIDSPYKSVLKLALMEAYAQQPPPPPLSLQFKQKVYRNQLGHDDIDPYLLIYQAVEDHLLRQGRLDRLDLIRRCFYLKTGEKLSQAVTHPDWRRPLLQRRIQEWGWSRPRLQELDQRRQWKLERVQEERKQLVQELIASFRALSAYARQDSELARSRQDELTVLGRKLFAMLEKRAGKIERLDIGIAPDLQEPALTLRAESPYQFSLLRGRHDQVSATSAPLLKRSHHVLELLAWAEVNGLLTRRTRLALITGDTGLRLPEMEALARALLELLPQPLPPPDDQDLRANAELRRAAVFVNLGIDPMAERTKQGLQLVSSHTDALAYGSLREQLVQSIDLIWLNSWGEVQIESFSEGEALPQLLLALHQRIGSQILTPVITVHCFCVHRADSIARRVTEVIDQFCGPIRRAAQTAPIRYVLRLGQGYRQFRLGDEKIDVIDCADFAALLRELEQPLPPACELLFEPQAISDVPLHLIYGQRRQGAVQIFFRAETDRVDVYLLDEADALAVAQQPFSTVELLLKPWYLFLIAVAERQQAVKGLATLPEPELFELMPARDGEPAWLRRHALPQALHQQQFFAVTASARIEQHDLQDLELQCAGQDYSALVQGDRFLEVVARDILHQRRTLGRYPIYVTDLTLNRLPDNASTALFVRYKLQIEEQLNRAAGLLS
ncbi:class I adenylate cyclase [Permianibacter sp. IMCC34836]|uniref:class I adenylate cyclase n=1 Tax=Permianibacter fluminis TaxID=2738515 RepID=UPI0015536DD6|nr:class I adenylate cyclase [Permianibacter fluminis]NQD36116.1 class I adenylate cyclase [Permianibacter fluminis]